MAEPTKESMEEAIALVTGGDSETWQMSRRDVARRLDELKAEARPWDCSECGQYVAVDEDGCCITCGRDATTAERVRELLKQGNEIRRQLYEKKGKTDG